MRESKALSRLSFKYGVSGCSPMYSAGPELEPEFVFVVECFVGLGFLFLRVGWLRRFCTSAGLMKEIAG